MPTIGGGDDFVWIGGPDEGLWLLVVVGDEAIDGGLEIDDAFEDTALEAPLGEDGEETLDGVEPTGRGGREMEAPARMTPQPLGRLAGRPWSLGPQYAAIFLPRLGPSSATVLPMQQKPRRSAGVQLPAAGGIPRCRAATTEVQLAEGGYVSATLPSRPHPRCAGRGR